jgi:hypothetical protein
MSVAPPNRRPSLEVVRARRREIAHRYRRPFSLNALRRREIERYAIHIDVADTDDLDRILIAWVWHNPDSAKPLWEVMHCASRLGRDITNGKAAEILEEASITRPHRTADSLGRFLGLTFSVRKALGITTIRAKDVGGRVMKELRKRQGRLYQQGRRRSRGARPHSQSLSQTKPWEARGMKSVQTYTMKFNPSCLPTA